MPPHASGAGAHPALTAIVSYETPDEAEESSFDPLRDGPLRYCGYANEAGEAFAAWLPIGGVPASYAVAVLYVLVDTYDKAATAHRSAAGLRLRSGSAAAETAAQRVERVIALLTTERAVDTLVWQLLASVIIPGFTIHQVVHFVHAGFEGAVAAEGAAAAAVLAFAATAASATGLSPDQVRCNGHY